jgi:hypothetical protein
MEKSNIVPGDARSPVAISLVATVEISIAMGVFFRSGEANLPKHAHPSVLRDTPVWM